MEEESSSVDFLSFDELTEPSVRVPEGERKHGWTTVCLKDVVVSPTPVIVSQTQQLSSILLYHTNSDVIKPRDNTLVHVGNAGWESCIFCKDLTTVCYLFL